MQDKLDADILGDDLELEDQWSGCILEYRVVKETAGLNIEVDAAGVELVDDEVTPDEVLRAEITEMESLISWDTESLQQHKAFLDTLARSEAA